MSASQPFLEYLRRGFDAGGFGTDDVLAAVLPLFEQVAAVHARDQVAPLEGVDALRVEQTHLWFEEARASAPRKNAARIAELQRPVSSGVEIVGDRRIETDLDAGERRMSDGRVGPAAGEAERPAYLAHYRCWEHACGHHDQLTDLFSLGLVLASLACGLDLSELEDVERFAEARTNLFALNPRLHPVIAATIVELTELNRHRRTQTVAAALHRLRHYREQSADYVADFTQLKGYRDAAPKERGQIILAHLRNRLFEISRRNRLIHFRPTLQTLNLTLASVPLLLDYRNIQAEQLFLWHDEVAKAVRGGESISLGKYLRFEDAPYVPGVLDTIIAAARRDRTEFGFEQLRLVVAFLRWHNLKETPHERIHSPLLLVPVELTRKKGVRDAYVLRATSSEAEVNPALRHHLRQLYGLNLPARIDLNVTSLDAFHAALVEQIRASEPGVLLAKVDRPQIELIHERAKQRLDQFRRKQRLQARGAKRFESLDYSYDRERYRPLGMQLFHTRVKPSRLPFGDLTDKPPPPRLPQMVADPVPAGEPPPGTDVKEKDFYAVRSSEGSGNPYQWEFDLCSLTLGNFNYRKMSLVQDYASLLERETTGSAFPEVFSLQPKPVDSAAAPLVLPPLEQQFPVIACDPTQSLAVARARTGASYIIQGPPGTGKSQTITNLIADYVARGKRVLFVCEKRAAIDVVYHRLGRQGLDPLCCLIHDSQTDKKEFIRDLKQTYEGFLAQPVDEQLEARRAELGRRMDGELTALRRWNEGMRSLVSGASLTVRELLLRLVELHPGPAARDPLTQEQVPPYGVWSPHAEIVRTLAGALRQLGGPQTLARHSFRHLTAKALTGPQPLATIGTAVDRAATVLARIEAALAPLAAVAERLESLGAVEAAVVFAVRIRDLAAADALELLNPRSAGAKRATKAVREWRATQLAHGEAAGRTGNWKDRLPPEDTADAIPVAAAVEDSALRWLKPSFWRLRGVLQARYDFSRHAVPPKWSQLLRDLEREHAAVAAERAARRAVEEAFGELGADAGVAFVEEQLPKLETEPAPARALLAYLVENPEAGFFVEQLAALPETLGELRASLGLVVEEFATLPRASLAQELARLRADLVWLPDLLPVLVEVLRVPPELGKALRTVPLDERQFEAAMALRSLRAEYQHQRALEATNGGLLARRVARLETAYHEWLALNAAWVRQRVRREFLRKVHVSGLPASQLRPEEKELKRLYATGRRELEHEFSKTMRHRSIRDLADDETGVVLRDLKPVWLMSPLSVSDTLPLTGGGFDVVIFDEASQIPVEEAVPAVFRGAQLIVVGDEMQLPPTNFFSASRHDEEALVDDGSGEEEVVGELDADSFLTQSARNLPSTMLGWHYRSRSEALISFSNHAFYEGRLLTVPDRQRGVVEADEIVARVAEDARANTDRLLARSVSFHHLPEAVYERRSNTAEAEYIAQLVRELLARDLKLSLGVVAFSEAQQSEIERALERLAADDAVFRNRLESEYEREDEGQFVGLFVKNLENVQGDERDVILLSVCYGHDRGRRMLMNFGPINQRGGEKRLNVIFSRARKHMAVVSSIRHFDITNDYNDGANCLKNFLEYAAAHSRGDAATTRRVLGAANPQGGEATTPPALELVATQLGAALRERGWCVEENVGQSQFRLPLAVRAADSAAHQLGVLLDDRAHYAQENVLESYLLRPGVLRAFGWRTLTVFTKDWFHDPDGVVQGVERALRGEVDPGSASADDSGLEGFETPPEPVAPSAPTASPGGNAGAGSASGIGAGATPFPSVAPTPGETRRYECVEDGAKKFWEVVVTGKSVTVRFGRLGTNGQNQTKEFATEDASQREADKLVRSKLAKGYVAVARS